MAQPSPLPALSVQVTASKEVIGLVIVIVIFLITGYLPTLW